MSSWDLVIDGLQRRLMRLSGRATIVLAALIYAGGGLVVPLALNWSAVNLAAVNVLATASAGFVVLCWLLAQVEATRRRQLVEWTTDLRLLTAEEFEWLVGEVFRREGWEVRETGRQDGPDGNVDLELTRLGHRVLAQCKRWTSRQVGVVEVRELAGTLLREGLSGGAGILVTLSDFTTTARVEAKRMDLVLVDGRELFKRMERVRRLEPCDRCGDPMVLGRSPHGWWFRCVATGCQGKRDLGSDPGRAVDLLTMPPNTA